MAFQIFICYRRDDSAYAAGRLYDRLSTHFGKSNVFMDIDAIELGVNFRERIENAVGHCDVLIAMIGKEWLSIKDDRGQRRLDDPNDFVRLEIQAALKRDIRVIPVLIDEASMPETSELPGDLSALSERNGLEIRHRQFNEDVNQLIKGLEEIFSRVQAVPPRASGEEVEKVPGGSAISNWLGILFRNTLIGITSSLIIGGLAATISGYAVEHWMLLALLTNGIGGVIAGLLGTKKWKPVLIGMFAGGVLVLVLLVISGESAGTSIASALVLGCGPGGVLGAIVEKVRSRK